MPKYDIYVSCCGIGSHAVVECPSKVHAIEYSHDLREAAYEEFAGSDGMPDYEEVRDIFAAKYNCSPEDISDGDMQSYYQSFIDDYTDVEIIPHID